MSRLPAGPRWLLLAAGALVGVAVLVAYGLLFGPGTLQPLEGVRTAYVDVPQATVEVTYDRDAASHDDLVAAIGEQGYDISPKLR
jgi:hypothetical protein